MDGRKDVHFIICVLVLTGIGLIFFMVATMVLYFEFVMKNSAEKSVMI